MVDTMDSSITLFDDYISVRQYLVYVMCGDSLNSHPNGFSCLRLVGI